jgi:hypothetical protein
VRKAEIACSLEPEDSAERWTRWRTLAARGVVDVVPTDTGLRLIFRAGGRVEDELLALVALERECCAFADWSVRAGGEQVVLDVSGDSDEAIAAVHGMLGSLG